MRYRAAHKLGLINGKANARADYNDCVVVVAGEVERLLREFTQNQEMVRNIGTHYYQIIYPVQLRQYKKMGISTREIGSSKVRIERSMVCHCTTHLILIVTLPHLPTIYVLITLSPLCNR